MSLIEILDWSGLSDFYYPNMVKKKEIGDGSCFFHSIADSFYTPYKLGKVNRIEFVKKLRHQLAMLLQAKNENGKIWYDSLSRGKLKEYSQGMPDFTLENMVKLLDSNQPIDNRFNEFVSSVFDKNIFIIDNKTKDVYITGKDNDILYKSRDSIVLIWYNSNHYDLVGVIEDNKLRTLFPYNHDFIGKIKERLSMKSIK